MCNIENLTRFTSLKQLDSSPSGLNGSKSVYSSKIYIEGLVPESEIITRLSCSLEELNVAWDLADPRCCPTAAFTEIQ